MNLKAEIKGTCARFCLDERPVLTVYPLISSEHRGQMGFFVDIGTEAYFKDLKITLL